MTDKQYYCKNGDLIEVGREYKGVCGYKILVVGFDGIYIIYKWLGEYKTQLAQNLQSLWQEQQDTNGWIKHTTGVQPVADDVIVNIAMAQVPYDEGCRSGLPAGNWSGWDNGAIKYYRIVEDRQDSELERLRVENMKLKDAIFRLKEVTEILKKVQEWE